MLWVLICTVPLNVCSYHVTVKRVSDMIKTYSQMHRTDKFSQHSSIIWQVWVNGWVFVYELAIIAPTWSKEFLNIQSTIECEFSLKRVRDMIRTYSNIQPTDKYSQYGSIIWPIWLNGWVFFYELSGCGFESSCSH